MLVDDYDRILTLQITQQIRPLFFIHVKKMRQRSFSACDRQSARHIISSRKLGLPQS